MAFSEVVAYFIILATAATLFTQGKTDIGSATDAAQALRPVAGDASAALLAIGLIGAGVLAIPILTGSAAYGVSELFGWKLGLNERPDRAPQFYGVIVLATVIGVGINFLGINPIDALVISAVINGLLAAPILVLVMLVLQQPRGDGRSHQRSAAELPGLADSRSDGSRRDRPDPVLVLRMSGRVLAALLGRCGGHKRREAAKRASRSHGRAAEARGCAAEATRPSGRREAGRFGRTDELRRRAAVRQRLRGRRDAVRQGASVARTSCGGVQQDGRGYPPVATPGPTTSQLVSSGQRNIRGKQ